MNGEEKNSQNTTAVTDWWMTGSRGTGRAFSGWGEMTELFWIPIVVVVTQLYVFVKTQDCTPQKMNFTVCKFFKNQ